MILSQTVKLNDTIPFKNPGTQSLYEVTFSELDGLIFYLKFVLMDFIQKNNENFTTKQSNSERETLPKSST